MEALMTEAGKHVSDLFTACSERTVTVSTDFGRVTLDADLLLYLFVTPRRERSWFLWDDLVRGAIGAVVLTDTRRPEDAREAVFFFESRDLPYIVALNDFGGGLSHDERRTRAAMAIGPHVPVVTCDARDRRFAAKALTTLVEYAIRRQLPTSRDGSDPRSGGRHHPGSGLFRADEVAG
jgi:signal recognition particle receptor subunit beta